MPQPSPFHECIEHMAGPTFIVDKEGWINDCNTEAAEKMMMPRETLLKERIFILAATKEATQLALSIKILHKMNLFKEFAELQDDPTPRVIKVPLTTAANEKTWYSFTIIRVMFETQNLYIINAQEVPGPVESLNNVEMSEQKYRHLFDTQPFAMMMINEKMRVAECNFKMETLTGYPMGELVGLKLSTLPFLKAGHADMLLDRYTGYLQKNQVEPPVIPIMTKAGKEIFVEVNGTALAIDKKMYIQVIAQDVTERLKMQQLMEEENKRLKELDTMRKSFITNASHEIKTPLTSIDGASAFLFEQYARLDDEQRMDLLKLVRRGSTRLKALLEALLDFSGVENKELSLTLAPAVLHEVINDAITSLSFIFNQRHHSVDIFVDPRLRVLVDKARLEQVLVNLISNAAKYTAPNGKIEITGIASNNTAIISVKDNGVGIDPEEMGKLFQKFGKIDRPGYRADIDIQGPGIGLYITREIITLHGGMIWAESAGRGKGSTFKFTMPLAGEASPGTDGLASSVAKKDGCN